MATSNIETIPVTDRAQWLALRMQDVTASDIAAACGVSPYKTPLRLYAEKTGAIMDAPDNAVLRRGRWLEPAGLYALQEVCPTWTVRKANVYLRDPALRIGATPDFVAEIPEKPGLTNIQMKTVAARVFNDWRDENGEVQVPLHYQLQALTEAKLMGAEHAILLAFITGEFTCEICMIDVPLHEAAWERIKGDVAHFWRCVEAGTPPAIMPDKDGKTLREVYKKESGEVLDLSSDNQLPLLLAERAAAMERIKADEAFKSQVEAEVMARLKDASVASLPGWSITWKTQTTKEYTVAARESRVLRITKQKEKSA